MICCKHFESSMLKPPLFNQFKDEAVPRAVQVSVGTSKTTSKKAKHKISTKIETVYEEPEENIIYNRYLFGIASQEDFESMVEFIERLKSLATTCNYNNMKDELIRDRLIIGISNQKVREALYSNYKLTLQEAVEICELNDTIKIIEKPSYIKTEPGYEVKNEALQTVEYIIDTPANEEEMEEEYLDYKSQVDDSDYELSDNSNIIEDEGLSEEEIAENPRKKLKKVATSNKSASHKCHLCNSWFTAQRNFLVHINDEYSHISGCDDCFNTLSSKYTFIQHSQECSVIVS